MSEEFDYMSDDFITDTSNEIRPGLIKTHKELRQHNLFKKKNSESNKKSIEHLQTEVLEESLKQPIDAKNRGFTMLEKMGFKSGTGLGKNNSGIKEPLGLNIKNNKRGLGHESAKIRKLNELKANQMSEDDFRAFYSKKSRDRDTLSDFRRSQRICAELDTKVSKSVPEESWFWPPKESTEPELENVQEASDDDNHNDNDDVELSVAEKLEMLTKYLRENYFYCIWCRMQYNDEKDLQDCPGCTRMDH